MDTSSKTPVILFERGVVVCIAVLMAMVGCTGNTPKGQTGASNTPVTSSPSADYRKNTQQVCEELKEIDNDFEGRYLEEVSQFEGKIDKVDANTKAAAVATAKKVLGEWAAALRQHAAKALDPAVKTAINDLAQAIEKIATAITKIEDILPAGVVVLPFFNDVQRAEGATCNR